MRPSPRLGRILRLGAVLLALGLVGAALVGQGPQAWAAVRTVGPVAAGASLVAVLAGLLASALVWRALLADLGSPLRLRPALRIFFVGQLGKYLPGSVFAIAAQMELGRSQGVPRSRIAAAGLLFMGVLVAAGLLVAATVLPFTSPAALQRYGWVLLALPVGLLCLAPPVLTRLVALLLRLLRREALERPLSWRGTGAALAWAVAMWVAYGVHLFVLVSALPGAGGPNRLLLSTGAYALAWTAGFVVVVAPAGAGVRELALVVALSPALPRGPALALAVLSRVLMTLGDLAWGAVGGLLRPRAAAADRPGHPTKP